MNLFFSKSMAVIIEKSSAIYGQIVAFQQNRYLGLLLSICWWWQCRKMKLKKRANNELQIWNHYRPSLSLNWMLEFLFYLWNLKNCISTIRHVLPRKLQPNSFSLKIWKIVNEIRVELRIQKSCNLLIITSLLLRRSFKWTFFGYSWRLV